MKNDYVVLSLDPMFSSLHSKIAGLVGKECHAITSCWSKKIYLRGFKHTLAQKLIKDTHCESTKLDLDVIAELDTYYHSYVRKIENRALTEEELTYMARFYLGLEQHIERNKITLVLLHNDTRWYHAIAISVCKKLNIEYLVTEQGLIRPFTTVLDKVGCNANTDLNYLSGINYNNLASNNPVQVTDKHDSVRSMCLFGCFIIGLNIEKWLRLDSILSYMHNDYTIRKYACRLKRKLFFRKRLESKLGNKTALLFLQLENDSQILQHSRFKNNSQVIESALKIAKELGFKLAIKRHPLDSNEYNRSDDIAFVDGDNKALSQQASLVITVNSSAVIDVIETKTPLILLGESIYARRGLGVFGCVSENSKTLYSNALKNVSVKERGNFLAYLRNIYLLPGAGASYQSEALINKLDHLLTHDVGLVVNDIQNNSIAEL
ncbi:phosphoribosylamine--glycine ligase [Vibrio campbellii]